MINNDEKRISLSWVEIFEHILPGIALICAGIIKLGTCGKLLDIIAGFIFFLGFIAQFVPRFFKKDKVDEASVLHSRKAATYGGLCLFIGLGIVLAIDYISKALGCHISVDYISMILFLMGLYTIISGILFIYYERVGDC